MLPYLWRVSLRAVRAILGFGCTVLYWFLYPHPHFLVTLLLVLYTGYSFAALFLRRMEAPAYLLANLAADAVFFLLWVVVAPSPGGLWVSVVLWAYLMATAILHHDWLRTLIVSALAAAYVFLLPVTETNALRTVVLAGGLVAGVAAVQKRHLLERVSHASRQSVLYRSEAQAARENERQRIAHDFHDGPLQSFISFQMRLEILRKLMNRDIDAASEELKQLQDLCRAQVSELRSFVRSMRPPEEGVSLGASISRLVEQFQRDTNISASFLSGDFLEPSETETSLELLQIIREALNNVQKHSHATRVAISASKNDSRLDVSIEDNGQGFPFSGTYTLEELELLRLGPASIKRRAKMLNADLTLESKPGAGAALHLKVPL
jgi:signal transduction histidine kinase